MTLSTLFNSIRRHPIKFGLGLIALASLILIPAIVIPVVVTNNQKPSKTRPSITTPTNRLLLSFNDTLKTLKSRVPPDLHSLFDEITLPSSSILIATFADSDILNTIRNLVIKDKDLLNLLDDTILTTLPRKDPIFLNNLTSRRSLNDKNIDEDPLIKDQWYLNMINATDAWKYTKGSSNIIVAVIDTGCDLQHPDLQGNIWVNTREIPNNGVDDDGNGYIDDYNGYDFAGDCRIDWRSANTTCGSKPSPQDVHSHGTHCAGIIAAVNHNGQGVSGISPQVKVMCLKVADPGGTFYTSHVLKAYDYALRMGAHIVSCSFGPSAPSYFPTQSEVRSMANETRFYETALSPLISKGVLVVAAAGNENANLDNLIKVGASYNPCTTGINSSLASGFVCIAATDSLDQRWEEMLPSNTLVGSNYGASVVHLSAPGRRILSTVLSNSYELKTGSSMATPLTAGVAALVLSVIGGGKGSYFKGPIVKQLLIESADQVARLKNVTITGRRLNAGRALSAAIAYANQTYLTFPVLISPSNHVLYNGFTETYYNSTSLELITASVRPSPSIFRSFSLGQQNGTVVIINSTYYAPIIGLYRISITTTAINNIIAVTFGSRTLPIEQLLNSSVTLQVATVGYYAIDIRIRYPQQPMQILMSTPTSPVLVPSESFWTTREDTSMSMPFFTPLNTPATSTQFMQIRYNESNSQPPSLPPSKIYSDSAVFMRSHVSSELESTFQYINSRYVYGIANAHIVSLDSPISLLVECYECAVSINGLLVADVKAKAQTSCIMLPKQQSNLAIIFVTDTLASTRLRILYAPCESPDDVPRISISNIVSSHLFLNSSNPSLGYVYGMQCDAWQSDTSAFYIKTPPSDIQPTLSFRLPIGLALSKTLKSPLAMSLNPAWQQMPCRASRQKINDQSPCATNFALMLRDIQNTLPATPSGFIGHPLERAYIRCWSYINRPVSANQIQVLGAASTTMRISLGGHILHETSVPNLAATSFASPIPSPGAAPQLFVYEAHGLPGSTFFGLVNFTIYNDARNILVYSIQQRQDHSVYTPIDIKSCNTSFQALVDANGQSAYSASFTASKLTLLPSNVTLFNGIGNTRSFSFDGILNANSIGEIDVSLTCSRTPQNLVWTKPIWLQGRWRVSNAKSQQ